ncbi:unnamed protein product [Arctogadus glacialis]
MANNKRQGQLDLRDYFGFKRTKSTTEEMMTKMTGRALSSDLSGGVPLKASLGSPTRHRRQGTDRRATSTHTRS